jgi:hypothetical protein
MSPYLKYKAVETKKQVFYEKKGFFMEKSRGKGGFLKNKPFLGERTDRSRIHGDPSPEFAELG